ncbi:DUF4307 domain-containing protein [Actinotalea ferrariae]|nr:DUF4307 domain-containing protein [Actinotalea ferrariae]
MTSSAASPSPPAGRYGPEPRPGAARVRTALVALLAAGAVALAVWIGLGAGSAPVSWKDVGFTVQDGSVDVTFDVIRPDPSVAVECRLQALSQQHAQVGVVVVAVAPAEDRVQRLRSTVAVSEPAVTGVVESCWTV